MWNVAISPGWNIFSVSQSWNRPFLLPQQGCEPSEAAGQAQLGGDSDPMGSASSFWTADFSLCTILKEGYFFSTLTPLIWFFLTPRWGQKQCSNKKLWWCALKSTQAKFIYFSLGWRLGCVFFVQTLFLNSEAKHSLAFVGFFFFLELPFVCIGRKIALLLRISKSVLLLQPWRCGYIKERKGF